MAHTVAFSVLIRGASVRAEFQWTCGQGQRQELLADRRVRRQPHLLAVWARGAAKL